MLSIAQDQSQFELLQTGDRTAYAYFIRRHQEGIYHYFRRIGADAQLARDLCQDVFKRVWDTCANMNTVQHLEAYLYVMARHLFLDFARKYQRITGSDHQTSSIVRMEVGANKELENTCHRVIHEMNLATRGLTAQRRLVLKLLYVDELDVPVVAEMLGLSPQTVRNTKAQATNFLRRKLYDRDLLMGPAMRILLRYIQEQ